MTFCLYHGATEISIQYKISLQRLLGLNPTVSEIIVVHSLSCVQLFETLWTAARQASLSFTLSQNLLKFTSIESLMPARIRWAGVFSEKNGQDGGEVGNT